jgi:hypothetical protein
VRPSLVRQNLFDHGYTDAATSERYENKISKLLFASAAINLSSEVQVGRSCCSLLKSRCSTLGHHPLH